MSSTYRGIPNPIRSPGHPEQSDDTNIPANAEAQAARHSERGSRLSDMLNRVTLGDCIPVLRCLPDACVDLVLTDPPFIAHYKNRSGQTIANDDNSRWLYPAFSELYRVLKPDRFCISFYG